MDPIQRFSDYEIDYQLFQIRRRGHVVPVERRVFDLIAYLVRHSARVVPKEELFEHVWEGRAVTSGSLTVAIAAARKALRDSSANPQIIITHRGRGYRFNIGLAHGCDSEGDLRPLCERGVQFVGREEEVQVFTGLLEEASAGRARFAVVIGEPGIGKSRLLDEFAAIAQHKGAHTAFGRCREEDGAPSFWPWIQISRAICSSSQFHEAIQCLVVDAPEIARGVPELRPMVSGVGDHLPAENARFRLFDGYARFLEEICKHRVLVVLLDDVHRADKDSLLLLEFIFQSLRTTRLLVIATHRPGDLRKSRERSSSVAKMLRDVSGASLDLCGLSASEISRLVRDTAGWSPSTEQARLLEDLTGGNPFFLRQLTGILRRDGIDLSDAARVLPVTARDAIAQHLKGLRAETLELLTTASVIGRQFPIALLARVTCAVPVSVAGVLLEAVDAGVVLEAPGERGGYRFTHALVRDVLYQGLGSEERAILHGAVGRALDADAARDSHLAEVAFHFGEAAALGSADIAIARSSEAAESARRAVAYDEAVRHRRRALRVLEEHGEGGQGQVCSILLDLGADLLRSGDREKAKHAFDRAARNRPS